MEARFVTLARVHQLACLKCEIAGRANAIAMPRMRTGADIGRLPDCGICATGRKSAAQLRRRQPR